MAKEGKKNIVIKKRKSTECRREDGEYHDEYPTEEDARKAADLLENKFGLKRMVEKCGKCSHFHLLKVWKCGCSKDAYNSESFAEKAVLRAARKYGKPQRAYKCDKGVYHLTSKDISENRAEKIARDISTDKLVYCAQKYSSFVSGSHIFNFEIVLKDSEPAALPATSSAVSPTTSPVAMPMAPSVDLIADNGPQQGSETQRKDWEPSWANKKPTHDNTSHRVDPEEAHIIEEDDDLFNEIDTVEFVKWGAISAVAYFALKRINPTVAVVATAAAGIYWLAKKVSGSDDDKKK